MKTNKLFLKLPSLYVFFFLYVILLKLMDQSLNWPIDIFNSYNKSAEK